MFLKNVSKYFLLSGSHKILKNFIFQQDTRTYPNLPKLDLHVLPCYDLGITGKGVRVSILDDGIEYTHQDLRDNYVSINIVFKKKLIKWFLILQP